MDSADLDKLDAARSELQSLLEKPELAAIPVLVLGNKADLKGALKITELIDRLCVISKSSSSFTGNAHSVQRYRELSKITNREISAYSISAKDQTNIDAVLTWLTKRA